MALCRNDRRQFKSSFVNLMSLSGIRRDYQGQPLNETDMDADPMRQFAVWFEHVRDREPDPTAMALATATGDGRPSVRVVLLKGVDARGFQFFTNYDSRKGLEMAETGRASLLFYWPSLNRQVRIDGVVEKLTAAESDAYFDTRPLESRWSVYASRQSAPVASRAALEDLFAAARDRYGDSHVPRPAWWGGYRAVPEAIEFWQGRTNRLHDRLRYTKLPDGAWQRARLAPSGSFV